MSPDNDDSLVTVAQVDREAAASFYERHLSRPNEVPVAAAMRMGHIDESPLIQTFARHRLAHQPSGAEVEQMRQRASGALCALGFHFELRGGMRLKVDDDGGVGTGTGDEAVMYDALEDIAALCPASSKAEGVAIGERAPVMESKRDETAHIVRWINQAVENAGKHGNTEGIWLFAGQWRVVAAALTAAPTPPSMSPDREIYPRLASIPDREVAIPVDGVVRPKRHAPSRATTATRPRLKGPAMSNETSEDAVDLLPCPFCGGADGRLVQCFTQATKDFAFWSVECLDCGCEIADDESQVKANEAWNRRALAFNSGVPA